MNTTTFIVLKPPRPEDSPGVKATAKKKGEKPKKIQTEPSILVKGRMKK